MKIDSTLSDIFDMEVLPPEETKHEIVEVIQDEIKPIDDDFEHTRDNLRDLLEKGKDALEHALELAKSGENARSYEVVGAMMKQLADINQQLLDLHIQRNKIKETSTPETKSNNSGFQQNNVFVGSTAELAKMIKDMRKGDS